MTGKRTCDWCGHQLKLAGPSSDRDQQAASSAVRSAAKCSDRESRQTVTEICAYGVVRSSILSDRGNRSLRSRLTVDQAHRARHHELVLRSSELSAHLGCYATGSPGGGKLSAATSLRLEKSLI
jgi:hypothetical protein